jgi:hypothetical protein
VQLGQRDSESVENHQHFPSDVAVLQPGAPLRELLHDIRDRACEGADVQMWVRAYAPVATASVEQADVPAPLLSVLVRTQNRRPHTLEETLLSLAAQTCQDFEVLLLVHDVPRHDMDDISNLVDVFPPSFKDRVRVMEVDGGARARPLNVGVREARGDYVAILDDDDVVFAHWVAQYKAAAEKQPGRVLRALVAEQEIVPATWSGNTPGYDIVRRPRCIQSAEFDLIEYFALGHSPNCGWAVPRSAFMDMGLEFDETIPVLDDWTVVLQAVQWHGVAAIEDVTSLWRRWKKGESSTSEPDELAWSQARTVVLSKLDAKPILLPERWATKLFNSALDARAASGTIQTQEDQINHLTGEITTLRHERDQYAELYERTERDRRAFHDDLLDAHGRLWDIWRSTSWKLSRPMRFLERAARRGKRRPNPDR